MKASKPPSRKGRWTASAATKSGPDGWYRWFEDSRCDGGSKGAGGPKEAEGSRRSGSRRQDASFAKSLPSLKARVDMSRAATLQDRLSIAARVLPFPQPSSRTLEPAGRSGSFAGAPRQILPFSRYSRFQARRSSLRSPFRPLGGGDRTVMRSRWRFTTKIFTIPRVVPDPRCYS